MAFLKQDSQYAVDNADNSNYNPQSIGSSIGFRRPLPIGLPLLRNGMLERRVCGHQVELFIADPPVVFAPRHLIGVSGQIWAGDVMVLANLGPAHS